MFSRTDIEKYFNAEKKGSSIFLSIGLSAVISALIFFLVLRHDFYRGASIPLLLIGLILAVIGVTIYRRSDKDRIRNVYAFDMNPSELRDKEWPRMRKVMRNFIILRWMEIFMALTGAGLYIYFIRDIRNDFLRGFGLALTIMALLALWADHLAEKRGRVYLKGLEDWIMRSV